MPTARVLVTDYAWPDLEIEQKVLADSGAEVVAAPEGTEATLVEWAADADAIMAPKSTWFEPKLRDGLLTHLI